MNESEQQRTGNEHFDACVGHLAACTGRATVSLEVHKIFEARRRRPAVYIL